jgi:DNA primase
LLLDGDIAGKLATDKIFQKLSENNFTGKSLYLPEKCDPDDFVVEYGPENLINATKELLESDSPYLNIVVS